MRLFIDECLSPQMASELNAASMLPNTLWISEGAVPPTTVYCNGASLADLSLLPRMQAIFALLSVLKTFTPV